jgi:hypothetical protein
MISSLRSPEELGVGLRRAPVAETEEHCTGRACTPSCRSEHPEKHLVHLEEQEYSDLINLIKKGRQTKANNFGTLRTFGPTVPK